MKSLFFLFITLVFFTTVQAKEDQETIYVKLENEVQLLPLYVAPIIDDSSGFSKDYLKSLEKILRFDLGHNGMTFIVKSTSPIDQLNKTMGFDFKGDLSPWMDQGVYFVVKLLIKNKDLSTRLLVINSQSIKSINGISLTGNLNQDRIALHNLSDTIHKTLFDKEGIATTKVLYTVKNQDPTTKKWLSDIYEADYDGGNAHKVTKDGGYCVNPAYIPPKAGYKSGSFVTVSYKIGQPKIYLGNLKDGSLQRFSLLKGNQLMPTISRQKDKIAFICDITGNPDLFLQEFDPESGPIGKPRQIFATHKATQGTPSFSPDGRKIAFVSNKDGSPRIYVMDIPPEGAKLKDIKAKLITKSNRENTAPCWSPDGKKIAFCAQTKGTRQVWMYDFETGSERQLTQGPGNKENPTWAPNSLHLMFNSSDAGASDLYLINLNQREAVQISQGPGEKHFPSWEYR